MATPTLTEQVLIPLAGDVLDECTDCTWWVSVDELVAGRCAWCRGAVFDDRR